LNFDSRSVKSIKQLSMKNGTEQKLQTLGFKKIDNIGRASILTMCNSAILELK